MPLVRRALSVGSRGAESRGPTSHNSFQFSVPRSLVACLVNASLHLIRSPSIHVWHFLLVCPSSLSRPCQFYPPLLVNTSCFSPIPSSESLSLYSISLFGPSPFSAFLQTLSLLSCSLALALALCSLSLYISRSLSLSLSLSVSLYIYISIYITYRYLSLPLCLSSL